MRAEPVVYFEDAGEQHDQRDVEGEAGGRACAVHRVDLVAIACDRGCGDTVEGVNVWWVEYMREDEQYRRNVLDDFIDETHVVDAGPGRAEGMLT